MLLDQAVMRDLTQDHMARLQTPAHKHGKVLFGACIVACAASGSGTPLMMSDAYILMRPRLNVIAGTCATRSSQVQ